MYQHQPTIGVIMEDNEKQALKEVETATRQLDMWASALGMSKEDLKDCKLKAIQELAEEEAKEGKCNEYCKSGCKCNQANNTSRDNGLNNMLPFLSMLTTIMGSGLNHPAPQINLHLHLAK